MKHVTSVEKFTHNIRIFYLSAAAKSAAIAMPHAILTLIFLKKGITYSQIAAIQAVYSSAIILFEFPSGILADKYSKKILYISSNIVMLLCYIIVLNCESFFMRAFAWFLYGTANAFETGTLDSHIIITAKKICEEEKVQTVITEFIGKCNSLAAISSILGAGIGFILYQFIDIYIYHIMLLLMCISGIFILFQYQGEQTDETQERPGIIHLMQNTVYELKNSRALRWIIAGFGVLQIYIQIHFQMWQSFFLELGYYKKIFLGLYLLFQVITIIVYRLPVFQLMKKYMPALALLGVMSVLFLYLTAHRSFSILFYCVPVIIVFMLQYYLEILYGMKVREENISSLTSLTSTIMRCFGAFTLFIAGITIKHFSLRILYLVFPLIAIIGGTFICNINRKHFTASTEKADGNTL